MDSLKIPSNGKIAVDYQPSLNFDSCIDTTTYVNNHPPLTSTLTLAQQVRNPLTCIYIAVEMLESEVNVNDRKLYMDIIKRGSLRINNLVNELIKSQTADELQKALMI